MSIPTTAINESSPSGSDNVALGDNRIREYKTQNREILEVDHEYPSSGQSASAGQHKKVTLQEQADLGTGAVSATIFGSQTVGGKGELVYTDEDDNDIQITSAGALALSATANKVALMNLVYPVGSIVTLGVSTNPATLYGVGTWTAIAGKVIVGIDGTQTEFDTLNETGGAKTHTLSTDEMPSHAHTVNLYGVEGTPDNLIGNDSNGTLATTNPTSSVGGGQAHNNLQPYIIKYVWERTA